MHWFCCDADGHYGARLREGLGGEWAHGEYSMKRGRTGSMGSTVSAVECYAWYKREGGRSRYLAIEAASLLLDWKTWCEQGSGGSSHPAAAAVLVLSFLFDTWNARTAAMAPGGLLQVTVVSANLLNATDGGSDSATEDAYAAVVCGSDQFTTKTVTKHETRPSWNESHTFHLDEYNEVETQHILVEIFAEKPKLDELLGLAKIPLSKVIASGDETSVHSLNRPDDIYSGHVKVSMKWDSKQFKASVVKSAYPEAFTPCARYDPNATGTRPPSLTVDGQGTRDRSGDMSQQQDDYEVPETSEKRAHHRSSSYPSRAYDFSPAASPSSTSRGHQPKGSYDGSYHPRSPGHLSRGQPPPSPGSLPNGHGPLSPGSQRFPSNGYPVEPQHSPRDNGSIGAGQNGRGSAPHVPYVANQGQQAVNVGGHIPYPNRGAAERELPNSDLKPPEDAASSKLSRSRQAEMAKLAELSKLTESAKYLSSGFAQPPPGQHSSTPRPRNDAIPSQQQQVQGPPRPRNDVLPTQQQQFQGSTKSRNDIIPSQQHQPVQNSPKARSDLIPSQQQQLVQNATKARSDLIPTQQQQLLQNSTKARSDLVPTKTQPLQISSKPRNEIVPVQQQQLPTSSRANNPIISQQQQFQSTSRPNNHVIPSQQQQLHRSRHEAAATPQVPQAAPPKSLTVYQGPVYDGIQQKSQNHLPSQPVLQRATYGLPQQMVSTPGREQQGPSDARNGNETQSNQLQIVTHRPDAEKKPPQKPEKLDKKAEKAARRAEKEAHKAEKEARKAGKGNDKGENPERESHVNHIRQTLNMLRKTSKIFR
ncbi:hypothetical protein R1flu_010337 [Riccia fluitans]|uniref:C2 domain-containing protein n=1 Tax=Riccia fluitans TaxID=41844 RepID=A0ABD1Z4Q0_9MARC